MRLLIQEHSGANAPVIPSCCGCSSINDLEVIHRKQKNQRLGITIGLIGSFFVAQLAIGLWSHSLSLLADAGHLLSDVAALGLTLLASWLAQRPA